MSSHQAEAAAEPLLPQYRRNGGSPLPDADGPPPDDAAAGCRGRSIEWIKNLGFVFYILNCLTELYWYKGPAFTLSNLSLIAFLVCLKGYENAEPGSQLRGRLKVAVWLLTTALALSFSYMVASVAPPAVAVLACLMAFGAVAGGLYYLWPKM
ncbi:hypothetical protein EJB05_24818, partial [Eragrostis curvula]